MMNILVTKKSDGYELIDSGEGEKLERFGKFLLSRPDPQALWPKSLSKSEWQKADATFLRNGPSGKWNTRTRISKQWQVSFNDLNFLLELLPSKHVGLFPEQSGQWQWLSEKIQSRLSPEHGEGNTSYKAPVTKVLNLFGYTGGATLACAKAGAEVCHVDSSKFALDLAMKNRDLSGLSTKPIRFIADDARKFVEREIKRGNTYDIIVMDPPVYGKGNAKEKQKQIWKIEKDLLPLLSRLPKILSKDPLAIVLNGYASGYSHLTYAELLSSVMSNVKGRVSSGELAIQHSHSSRMLPAGIFARFEK
jgi:23S rRNA (cytosine1962-C5)-methyltransferase